MFHVTRMRCWRITSLPSENSESGAASNSADSNRRMELAVEYLLSKENLKWITINTDQAILISMCLQVSVMLACAYR